MRTMFSPMRHEEESMMPFSLPVLVGRQSQMPRRPQTSSLSLRICSEEGIAQEQRRLGVRTQTTYLGTFLKKCVSISHYINNFTDSLRNSFYDRKYSDMDLGGHGLVVCAALDWDSLSPMYLVSWSVLMPETD